MAANGHLPDSALAPIPSGRLRKDAAAAWNAMHLAALKRYHVDLRPTGAMSSYRTYAQQVYLYGLYQQGRGNLAAIPGTSNHGWGLAVDLATEEMRTVVDRIGRKYGFAKAWSDAQSEWWHIRWRPGVWKPSRRPTLPALKLGSKGPRVRRTSGKLVTLGYLEHSRWSFDYAVRDAVRRFQHVHHLPIDGVAGPHTIAQIDVFVRARKAHR